MKHDHLRKKVFSDSGTVLDCREKETRTFPMQRQKSWKERARERGGFGVRRRGGGQEVSGTFIDAILTRKLNQKERNEQPPAAPLLFRGGQEELKKLTGRRSNERRRWLPRRGHFSRS